MAVDPKSKPSTADPATLKRVRSKAIDGLNASRMRPSRATYFMICVGNKTCLAYLGPAVGNGHKTLLRGLMGTDTGLKYHRGQCLFEAGYYIFVGPTLSPGMRKKLELGLITLTQRRWPTKIRRGPVQEGRQTGAAELQTNG